MVPPYHEKEMIHLAYIETQTRSLTIYGPSIDQRVWYIPGTICQMAEVRPLAIGTDAMGQEFGRNNSCWEKPSLLLVQCWRGKN